MVVGSTAGKDIIVLGRPRAEEEHILWHSLKSVRNGEFLSGAETESRVIFWMPGNDRESVAKFIEALKPFLDQHGANAAALVRWVHRHRSQTYAQDGSSQRRALRCQQIWLSNFSLRKQNVPDDTFILHREQ